MLPKGRRAAFERSGSDLTLGAGLLLSSLLHVRTDDDLTFGSYGKPVLSAGSPEFSLSHSGKHVLLGISDLLIGVDMEQRDRKVNEALLNRMCLPCEKGLEPLSVFTRKECAMKLTGLGFSLPLNQIDTTAGFRWQHGDYRFFTRETEGYVISVLTAEASLPDIQLLTPEDLL